MRWVYLFGALLFSVCGHCQHAEHSHDRLATLHYYYNLYCQADGQLAPETEELDQFVCHLEGKRSSFQSDKAFVYYIFQKAHRQYFHRFQEYSSFRDLVSNKIYNCLTGTALIATLLKCFDIDYEIIETNYHVFILAEHGSILLETTDRNGFIDNIAQINKLIQEYRTLTVSRQVSSKQYYEYTFNELDSVSLVGMLGLLHYNNSVKAYNHQQFDLAITHLQHGFLLHHSLKLEAFRALLIQTIVNSGVISEADKTIYLSKLRGMRTRTTASTSLSSHAP